MDNYDSLGRAGGDILGGGSLPHCGRLSLANSLGMSPSDVWKYIPAYPQDNSIKDHGGFRISLPVSQLIQLPLNSLYALYPSIG